MIGQDEQRILDALKSPALAAKQAKLIAADVRGEFKIEVHFGKNRSISSLKTSHGALLIWESGKRFHGGGDEKMYWCGYADCDKPIKSSLFGYFHVVCPHCQRESLLTHADRAAHVREARRQGAANVEAIERMPQVVGEKFFRMTPMKLAIEIERHWNNLNRNADIYIKYHPSDIRYQANFENAKTPDQLERARTLRGLLIYPVARQARDLIAGASPSKRFHALVTA